MTKPMLPRRKRTKRIDETGKRYGKLVVLEFSHTSPSQQTYWKCRCDCGMFHIASGGNLRFGSVQSCGCECGIKPLFKPTRRWSQIWSQAVKKRDNYICVACTIQDKINIDAHHILGVQEYPDLQFNINNGVTLCIPCHKKFHSCYGYYNFTRKDLERFIQMTNPEYHGWNGYDENGKPLLPPATTPMPLEVLRVKLAELRAAKAT